MLHEHRRFKTRFNISAPFSTGLQVPLNRHKRRLVKNKGANTPCRKFTNLLESLLHFFQNILFLYKFFPQSVHHVLQNAGEPEDWTKREYNKPTTIVNFFSEASKKTAIPLLALGAPVSCFVLSAFDSAAPSSSCAYSPTPSDKITQSGISRESLCNK